MPGGYGWAMPVGPDNERKTVTLSRMTVRYLEALKGTGTHGIRCRRGDDAVD